MQCSAVSVDQLRKVLLFGYLLPPRLSLSLFLCLSLLRCQAILTLTINSFDSLTTKVAKINDGYNYNFQLYETAVSFPRIGGHAAAACVHSLRMDGGALTRTHECTQMNTYAPAVARVVCVRVHLSSYRRLARLR